MGLLLQRPRALRPPGAAPDEGWAQGGGRDRSWSAIPDPSRAQQRGSSGQQPWGGDRGCAGPSALGHCCSCLELGLGGGWASREEKVGLSAGFPECYLLLLKINDALERFHFVSLTARPLHQPGRGMRRCSQRLLSGSSLAAHPLL